MQHLAPPTHASSRGISDRDDSRVFQSSVVVVLSRGGKKYIYNCDRMIRPVVGKTDLKIQPDFSRMGAFGTSLTVLRMRLAS